MARADLPHAQREPETIEEAQQKVIAPRWVLRPPQNFAPANLAPNQFLSTKDFGRSPLDFGFVTVDPTIPCCLCGRAFQRQHLTKHHCLPKSKGGTMEHVELLCGMCHGMVHATYTTQTLARVYPTIELLRQAPELVGFVKWVRKQPVTRRTRNQRRRQRL